MIMSSFDFIIVSVYLAALFAFAMYVGLRENAEDFLVLSRRAPFLLVLFSTISTWVGAGTTIATAAAGYETGLSLGLTASVGGLLGVLAAGLFAPTVKRFGDKYGAYTIGDFFLIRFSKNARYLAGALVVLVYLLLSAGQFVALASLGQTWIDLDFKVLLVAAALSTVVYTAFAGIKSDFYTDAIHFILMALVFFAVLLPFALKAEGEIGLIKTLPKGFFKPFSYGGVSFFVAGVVFGTGTVFITMELWQRIYASSSPTTARWALISSGIIIVGFYLVSSLLGMLARAAQLEVSSPNQALFAAMKVFLPKGWLGLGLAAIAAVVVSTVNSLIMVVSATLTKDFYLGLVRPAASPNQVLRIGRITTLCSGCVAFIIALALPNVVLLTVNAMFVLLCLLPSVLGGFFWARGTNAAAILSISLGFVTIISLTPFIPNQAFVPGFLVSLIVFFAASLLTRHSASETRAVNS